MRKSILRIGLIIAILVTGLLFVTQQSAMAYESHYNTGNSTVNTLADIFYVVNGVSMGNASISGDDIAASYVFFGCLDSSGGDLVACTATFYDTPLGQKVAEEAEIPSWVEDLLDGYIAVKEKDYWGVVYYFGEAVVCAAAQILLEGWDICGTIKELIQFAKDCWDTAVAVVEFLKDCGDAVMKAACWIGLGGCDDGPPPAVTIYVDYLAGGGLMQGLSAREAYVDGLEAYIAQVKVNAFNDPTDDLRDYPEAFEGAANIFRNAVDDLWDRDINQTVNPGRTAKQAWYEQAENISALASQAVVQSKPDTWLYDRCKNDFEKEYHFKHVDRWIIKRASVDQKKSTKTNSSWCSDFKYNHWQKEFKNYFDEYVNTKLCPKLGTKYICPSPETTKSCDRIMRSIDWSLGNLCVDKPPCTKVGNGFQCSSLKDFQACMSSLGDSSICGVNVAEAGMELAGMIDAEFKKGGSGSCPYTKQGQLTNRLISSACVRPSRPFATPNMTLCLR
jgi:hypothetical protein